MFKKIISRDGFHDKKHQKIHLAVLNLSSFDFPTRLNNMADTSDATALLSHDSLQLYRKWKFGSCYLEPFPTNKHNLK